MGHLILVDLQLEELAGQLSERVWSEGSGGGGAAWVAEADACGFTRADLFALVRREEPGERVYRYGFVMWESGEGKSPEAVLQAHGFKWAKGQHFSEEVSDMELRHPVCLELTAAQAF